MEKDQFTKSKADQIKLLAVAVQHIENGNFHTGFFYKKKSTENLRLCHLAWHCCLEDEEVQEEGFDYLWTESDLNTTVQKGIVAFLLNIIKNKDVNPVPYGFIRYGCSFDPNTGIYVTDGHGEGLTCATFILDVLSGLSLNLVNQQSWPIRTEDDEWREYILSFLKKRASNEHIKALEKAKGIVRFRPTEVTASFEVNSDEWPVNFAEVESKSQQIKTALMK